MTALARAAERCRPALLALLLIALLTSITAIGILTALLALVTLARLTDADARARYQLPLVVPILVFALVSLASALVSEHRGTALLYLRHLHLIALFFIAANEFRSGAEIRRALWWFGATDRRGVHLRRAADAGLHHQRGRARVGRPRRSS